MALNDATRHNIPLVPTSKAARLMLQDRLDQCAAHPLNADLSGSAIPLRTGQTTRVVGTRLATLPLGDVRWPCFPFVSTSQAPGGVSVPLSDRLVAHPLNASGGRPQVPLLRGEAHSRDRADRTPTSSLDARDADFPLVRALQTPGGVFPRDVDRIVAHPLNAYGSSTAVPLVTAYPIAARALRTTARATWQPCPLMFACQAASSTLLHRVNWLVAHPLNADLSGSAIPLRTGQTTRVVRAGPAAHPSVDMVW